MNMYKIKKEHDLNWVRKEKTGPRESIAHGKNLAKMLIHDNIECETIHHRRHIAGLGLELRNLIYRIENNLK